MTIREERHTQTGAFERITDILTHSPYLGHYIRFLSLVLKWVPDNWPPLESILSTTTRAERLAIQGINSLFTTELHSNPSLIEVLSLKTLRCVALTTVSMSPSIAIMVLKTFEEVCLSQIHIDPGEGDTFTSSKSHSLWHLDLSDHTGRCDGFFCSLNRPCQLESLEFLTHLSMSFGSGEYIQI
ncbi:hypothetical protein C8R45DRAFT_947640 [Mycena sanguinolenta]|nr:hypothetical protein C8R45DRAFT_947640 [Mycena sanguinolenta]